jgi:hypothetical protein
MHDQINKYLIKLISQKCRIRNNVRGNQRQTTGRGKERWIKARPNIEKNFKINEGVREKLHLLITYKTY